MAVASARSDAHGEDMSDLPFTPEDERAWIDDEPETGALDETDRIDARVLSGASERDALDQRRSTSVDDSDDRAEGAGEG